MSQSAPVVVTDAKLYLPGVEEGAKPGPHLSHIEAARARGSEYSKIWDLFAFQPSITSHLAAFTDGIIRQPSSISVAMRELIAAATSHANKCAFCTESHAAAAAHLWGSEDLVWGVLEDLETSRLSEKDKSILRFTKKITLDLPAVTGQDVEEVRAAGWDDEAIYFAVTTCALFNFYNRWIDGTGVPPMSKEAHRQQGKALASNGYIRKELGK